MTSSPTSKPLISLVVVVYDMVAPAMNTLYSLSSNYQQDVSEDEYEVIIIENRSNNNLDPAAVAELGDNFHYHLRDEPGVSPVAAANEGLHLCRGQYIAMIIDGARMLTPRVVKWAKQAYRLSRDSLTMVPGYHIGDREQQLHDKTTYNQQTEQRWLDELNWKDEGYRLFQSCHPSPGNKYGFLHPFMECSCLFAHASHFKRINGINQQFDLSGGGSVNLHLLRSLGMHGQMQAVILAGEGSFHQLHGGVTTSSRADREDLLKKFSDQLNALWDGQFHALRREPLLLGTVSADALPWLQHASNRAESRFQMLEEKGRGEWEDDDSLNNRARD